MRWILDTESPQEEAPKCPPGLGRCSLGTVVEAHMDALADPSGATCLARLYQHLAYEKWLGRCLVCSPMEVI